MLADQIIKCASYCHVNPLLETHDHHAVLTQFSVYFTRFIFWVSPYYQLYYNWAAGWAREQAAAERGVIAAVVHQTKNP